MARISELESALVKLRERVSALDESNSEREVVEDLEFVTGLYKVD